MSNPFRTRRRHSRQRIKQKIKMRRLQMFHLETQVKQLAGHQEAIALDVAHTHDLMTALEQKVQQLLQAKKQEQMQEQALLNSPNGFFALLRQVLRKGTLQK